MYFTQTYFDLEFWIHLIIIAIVFSPLQIRVYYLKPLFENDFSNQALKERMLKGQLLLFGFLILLCLWLSFFANVPFLTIAILILVGIVYIILDYWWLFFKVKRLRSRVNNLTENNK